MMNPRIYSSLIVLSFLAIYLIWGSTYLAILLGLESFPPFLLAAFRFAIAGSILMAYCWFKQLPQPNSTIIRQQVILGLIVLIGGQGLLIWAEQYIPSGYAAVIVASAPIWFVLLDKKYRRRYFQNATILWGVALGFVGIVLLFYDQLHQLNYPIGMTIIGSLAVVASVICWVSGTLYHQSALTTSSGIFTNLSWQLISAAAIGFMISFITGEYPQFSWAMISIKSWLALFYLAIAGSVIAFVAYTWLLTQKPAILVGTYAYINPIIAVFLGWLLARETVSNLQILATAIILFSAFIIRTFKP